MICIIRCRDLVGEICSRSVKLCANIGRIRNFVAGVQSKSRCCEKYRFLHTHHSCSKSLVDDLKAGILCVNEESRP